MKCPLPPILQVLNDIDNYFSKHLFYIKSKEEE